MLFLIFKFQCIAIKINQMIHFLLNKLDAGYKKDSRFNSAVLFYIMNIRICDFIFLDLKCAS